LTRLFVFPYESPLASHRLAGLPLDKAERLLRLIVLSHRSSIGRTEANNEEALAVGFITKPCTEATILKAVEIAGFDLWAIYRPSINT
jgi:hypothetical protein